MRTPSSAMSEENESWSANQANEHEKVPSLFSLTRTSRRNRIRAYPVDKHKPTNNQEVNMRCAVFLVLFMIVLPAFALSQVPKDETKKTPPAKTDAEQVLIKLDRDLLDAMLKKDNSMADRIEVANHVFINPGGGVE